jgi:hypothetical protein
MPLTKVRDGNGGRVSGQPEVFAKTFLNPETTPSIDTAPYKMYTVI